MTSVKAVRLTKIFARHKASPFRAIDDISFELNCGDVLGVVGRNGAGKSTLLKCLSRITRPSSGHAVITGKIASLLEVGTGFHPELSGRENIFLNGSLLGMKRHEIKQKFDAIVDFSGIAPFLDEPVKRYSSGMSIRLGFAVSSFLESDVLLLDEILAVGDHQFQSKCLDRATEVATQGRTVIFVSHNLGAVHRLCRLSLYLDGGRLAALGPTDQVLQSYTQSFSDSVAVYERNTPTGKDVELVSLRLVDKNGSPSRQIRYHDALTFELHYRVNRPVTGVCVGVGIGTSEYLPLFTTADYDASPQRLGERSVGEYFSRVEIPACWLNTGRYITQVYISNPNMKTVFDFVEAFTFEIVDSGTPASFHGHQFRRGVLQPILPWTVECRT